MSSADGNNASDAKVNRNCELYKISRYFLSESDEKRLLLACKRPDVSLEIEMGEVDVFKDNVLRADL